MHHYICPDHIHKENNGSFRVSRAEKSCIRRKKLRLLISNTTNQTTADALIEGFKTPREAKKELDSKYKVIQLPRDQFTNDLINLTAEQRKDFVKFNDQRRNNRKINLL
jgi:hypothetical protein